MKKFLQSYCFYLCLLDVDSKTSNFKQKIKKSFRKRNDNYFNENRYEFLIVELRIISFRRFELKKLRKIIVIKPSCK